MIRVVRRQTRRHSTMCNRWDEGSNQILRDNRSPHLS